MGISHYWLVLDGVADRRRGRTGKLFLTGWIFEGENRKLSAGGLLRKRFFLELASFCCNVLTEPVDTLVEVGVR